MLLFVALACTTLAQNTADYYKKREIMIPMRDGTRLYTAIYEPLNHKGSSPILMARTPYGCRPYGKEMANLFHKMHVNERGNVRKYTSRSA